MRTLTTRTTMWLAPVLAGTLLALSSAPVPAQTATPAPPRAGAVPPPDAPLNRIGEGRRLFLKYNCYSCHGMRAEGGMGPNIAHREIDEVRSAVMFGREGGMRSFADFLDEKDVRRIAAYLKSIGTDKEPMFRDWWVDIPPK
jgi:mono/diheme cytochrome c family protein